MGSNSKIKNFFKSKKEKKIPLNLEIVKKKKKILQNWEISSTFIEKIIQKFRNNKNK